MADNKNKNQTKKLNLEEPVDLQVQIFRHYDRLLQKGELTQEQFTKNLRWAHNRPPFS